MKHFIHMEAIHEAHNVVFLLRAPDLYGALMKVTREKLGAKIREDGVLLVGDGYDGFTTYHHPLECIESEIKSSYQRDWQIRELNDRHWEVGYAEVFCSAEREYDDDLIQYCRPTFNKSHPHSRARAFVWYLKEGPLVTFHRRKLKNRSCPIEVLGRYYIPWETFPQVFEWAGSLNDILAQLNVEYPGPFQGEDED